MGIRWIVKKKPERWEIGGSFKHEEEGISRRKRWWRVSNPKAIKPQIIDLFILGVASPPSFKPIFCPLLLSHNLENPGTNLNLTLVMMQVHFPYFEVPNGMWVKLVYDMLVSKICSDSPYISLDLCFSGLLSYCWDIIICLEWWLFTVNNGQKILWLKKSLCLAHAV